MPGPTRFYKSNAERQRACRKRKQADFEEESRMVETTATYAWVLQEAVRAALRAGDATAQKVCRDDPIDTLRALTDHFHDQAGTPAEKRPWSEEPRPDPGRTAG